MHKRNRNLIRLASSIVGITVIIFILASMVPSSNPKAVLEFMQNNPDKVSMTMIRNAQQLVQYQSDRKMPMASVAKIIVAVEYAQQAAQHKIDPEKMVSLEDLNRYYIPKLDGGAQDEWEKWLYQHNRIEDSIVSLREVAMGMIQFSSNANMEYLIELLGLDAINQNLQRLGLETHEPLYPFYSSLLIPNSLMKSYDNIPDIEKVKKAKVELKEIPQQRFQELALMEHEHLKNDADGSYKSGAKMESWYDAEFDKINSDRMVGATSKDYGNLLSKINSRHYFSPEIHKFLDEIMETAMESEGNQDQFNHLGFKGGSTSYVLNSAIYAVDNEGNKVEVVILMNELSNKDMKLLSKNLNEFLLKALTSVSFQNEIISTLSSEHMLPLE